MKKSNWLILAIAVFFSLIYSSCEETPTPQAYFDIGSIEQEVGISFKLSNSSSDSDSYEWDFGDGTTSLLENPTHMYTVEGNYMVHLKASNEKGTVSETSKKIKVVKLLSGDYVIESYYGDSGSTAGQLLFSENILYNPCEYISDTNGFFLWGCINGSMTIFSGEGYDSQIETINIRMNEFPIDNVQGMNSLSLIQVLEKNNLFIKIKYLDYTMIFKKIE